MRESIVIYRTWYDAVKALPESDQLRALRGIIDYGLDGTEPEDAVARAVFLMAKHFIDANNKRYENGKKGGRPKTNTEPNRTKQKPNRTKQKPNRNQTETKPKPKRETQEVMFNRLTIGRAINTETRNALLDWITYKAERGERYKEAGMKSLITQAVNAGAAYGADSVVELIEQSIANGYKGIIWDRLKKPSNNKFNNEIKRTYDMAALERELIASN